MVITGPNWPSTQALAEALRDVAPLGLTLQWGRRAANGWEQLDRFAQAGVRCPNACNTLAEARAAVAEGIPLWGRKLDHTQGTDIVGQRHRRWAASDFWVQPLQVQEEFRQHVWNGACIRIGQKHQTGTATRSLPVRSRRNGWTIDYAAAPEEPLRTQLRDTARAAVEALGYLGGAVDLVLADDGVVYALEVNAAPSLRDANTLAAYVKAIKSWARRQPV